MQAASLPARAGYQWVQQGWQIFRTQPVAFFAWAMFVSMILMLASVTPPIGPILFVVLMPLVTFVSLAACRTAASGQRLQPAMWIAPLRERLVVRRLLGMGALYMVVCLFFGVLAFMPFMHEIADAVNTATTTNNLMPLLEAARTPMTIFGVLYVMLAALFWYAPALVGWWGTSLTQSLFFSAIACWRNKWPFLVYGLVWGAVFIGVDLATSLLVAVGLPESLAASAQVPVNVVAGAVLYCSFYPSYVSVFEQSVADEVAPTDPGPPEDHSTPG